MLRSQLKQLAQQYFTIPENYLLTIDEVTEENSVFLWEKEGSDEGYYVQFDPKGQLVSLAQPSISTTENHTTEDLEMIAKQFLISHYPEALTYFTLTKSDETEKTVHFRFKQLIDGIPLSRSYCIIEVAYTGLIIEFNYRHYVENPPEIPHSIVSGEDLLEKLQTSEWFPELIYVQYDMYSVEKTGLQMIYQNPMLHQSFDAVTGVNLFEEEFADEIEEPEQFIALPEVAAPAPLKTIEEIISVPSTMKLIRQSEVDTDTIGMVWRDKGHEVPSTGSTMDSYIEQRFAETVKATVQVSTQQLKGFIWFQKRLGDLQLNHEQCLDKAVAFIKTYFPAYIPYLKLKVEQPANFEESYAFFNFSIFVNEQPIEPEYFVISINRTTGDVESLMTPKISVTELDAYTSSPLITLEQAKRVLSELEAIPQWQLDYEEDKEIDRLIYRFVHKKTKQPVLGIHAVTGSLITMSK
ncbi:MAG: DUF4901 domain-containing protein [Kurthia sp.]|nr:DUF4901 domain-containing protein [Candidatus Kurthia equi]